MIGRVFEKIKGKLNDVMIYLTMCLMLFIKSFVFIFLFLPKGTDLNLGLNYIFITTSMYVYFAFILFVTSFYFLIRGKHRSWYLFSINLLLTIIMFADLVFFSGFNSFLSLFHVKELSTIGEASSGIGSLIQPKYYFLFIDIILLIPIMVVTSKTNSSTKRSPIIFVLLLLIAGNCFTDSHRVHVFERLRYEPSDTMITQSPIGYHLYDAYSFIKSKYRHVNDKEKEMVNEWWKANKEELPVNEYSGVFKGKNLLTVHFESLEQFVINERVNGQEITPNLNKLLKNSLYFDNYHEIVNEGTSSDAEFTTNTSLYPIRKGAVAYVYPNLKYNTLPTILNQNGYQTNVYHSDKKIYWNWGELHQSLGFTNLYSEPDYQCNEYTAVGVSDGCFLSKLPDFIEKQKEPYYSFAVMMTSHMPFELPESYLELKLDESLEGTTLGNYFQAIHYSDKQLGLMLEQLDQRGLLDNTVVAVYGDHMGIHKYYANEVSGMKDIKEEWKEVSYKVPLIIYQKDYNKPKTISVAGNQTDFLPTMSYLLGIESKYYTDYAMGKVLVNTNRDYTLLNNGKIINGESLSDSEKTHLLNSFIVSDTIVNLNNTQ